MAGITTHPRETSSPGKPYPSGRMPTQDELPYSDDEVMESECHALQQPLIKEPLLLYWKDRKDFYVGTDIFVYFSPTQEKTHDFKGPDVFVALGVKPRPRKSFLVWEEGKGPDVVIEFISDSTADWDKTHKKAVYQDKLKVSEYYWCDPYSDDFAGFALQNGKYKRLKPDSKGMLHSAKMGLALTRWQGVYSGVEANWLRWATLKGILLPTGEELARMQSNRAEIEIKRANEERKRADEQMKSAVVERKRADALAALLKKHGIDPNG